MYVRAQSCRRLTRLTCIYGTLEKEQAAYFSPLSSQLDWFHWVFSCAWLLIMAELIPGTIPRDPPIRVLAMPATTMLWTFVLEFLLVDILRASRYRPPFRISSVSAGSPLRPGIYSVIEDVVAVDGGGGTEYRERLNTRYESSETFRLMIHRINVFWHVGGISAATLTTVLIWTLDREVAYVVSLRPLLFVCL